MYLVCAEKYEETPEPVQQIATDKPEVKSEQAEEVSGAILGNRKVSPAADQKVIEERPLEASAREATAELLGEGPSKPSVPCRCCLAPLCQSARHSSVIDLHRH